MSRKASPTVIGVFTLIGLILAVATMVLLGAGKLFKRTHSVLLYFDKSANGLQVGSDVRFGGVRIGKVKSIRVLVDAKENRKIIPVVVELGEKELGQIGTDAGSAIDFTTPEGVDHAVRQGLRAGMVQQSLLTGQLYVEFDMVPQVPGFTYHSQTAPAYPVVPTVGTEMDALIAGIADGLKKFNALDLENVTGDVRAVLAAAQSKIDELNIKEINQNLIAITGDLRKLTGNERLTTAIDHLHSAIVEIDQLSAKANKGIDPLLIELNDLIAKTDAGVKRMEEAAAGIAAFSDPRSPVLLRLQNTLQETERASRALKELSNDLKHNPKSLISGKDDPK